MLATGARMSRIQGCIEITGGRVANECGRRRMRFVAITLGHVILAIDDASLDGCRGHEHVHVAQYERFGVLLFVLYGASSVWQALVGRDAYFDNVFEREARRDGASR